MWLCASASLWLLLAAAAPAHAQGWTFDARKIALGNAGGGDHPASRMIDEQKQYRSIVLPIGLIQVLQNRSIFNPDSDEFDLVKAIELASSPLHYVVGRDSASESSSGQDLVLDIRNATISRDLNAYRGFVPARQPEAEGLAHTAFGATLPVWRGANGTSHGIFVGAGPYVAMRAAGDVDQRLIDILGSETNVYVANSRFNVGVGTRGELAAAITGGYRGRIGFGGASGAGGAGGERDGVYLALDYHHLQGFRYEQIDTTLHLDTDSSGLLTINPTVAFESPLIIGRDHSTSGRGFALDLGVGVVSGIVEAGFGVKGIANRINWTDVERTTHSLSANLFSGSADFSESAAVPIGDVEVRLPKDYRTYAGVHLGPTFAVAEFVHGFNGNSFHGGIEQGLGVIELRGGLIYSRDQWQPTGGIGLNVGPRVSLDLAAFGTSTNVENERRLAIAASLRFNVPTN